MTAPRPLRFRWDGAAMVPLYPGAAARQYETGAIYPLAVHEERSANSHRHFFACVNEAHSNLPEHLGAQFPTADHLRKWCLIKAGFRDTSTIPLPTKADALRVAAFIRPIDDFRVVVVHEATVMVYTAESQSLRAMGKARFQRSKDAVLDELASMIGTDSETLARNAGKAA